MTLGYEHIPEVVAHAANKIKTERAGALIAKAA